jgi:hypothetical protein
VLYDDFRVLVKLANGMVGGVGQGTGRITK